MRSPRLSPRVRSADPLRKFVRPKPAAGTGRPKHLGDVYLNGISFYEAGSLEELHKPKIREKVRDDWTGKVVPDHHPEQTKYLWYAEVDVQIHDCSLGMWLDWQAQGTRVSRNLFYRNNRDLFVEVSHGPYLVDHNIFASEYTLDNYAQGGAYVNNLICGKMVHQKVLDRATPYHLPHSTKMAGFSVVLGGDDRFYNNIFVGKEGLEGVGTAQYNGYTTSLEEYLAQVHQTPGDVEIFYEVGQPVYINNNVYLNGAVPFERELNKLVAAGFDPEISITEEEDGVYLTCCLPEGFAEVHGEIPTTKSLKPVRVANADFENPDGSEVTLDRDYFGERRTEKSRVGPFAHLQPGRNRIKVWSKMT